MRTKHVIVGAALLLATVTLAQQTGTVVGTTPGSAIGKRLPSVVQPLPPATCDARVAHINTPTLPPLIFRRMMDDLICVRDADGHSEMLLKGGPWMVLSLEGNDVAYWLPESHALHVYSIPSRSDTVVDTIPGANMRQIAWLRPGRVLAYALQNQPGIRVIALDSGKRTVLEKVYGEIAKSPDPAYLVTVDSEAVRRVRIADGQSEMVAALPVPLDAAYSPSGALLGIRASAPVDSPDAASDDDAPDCTGGLFALFVQRAGSQKPVQVPFPKGFESVLDFAFAPDDSAIAVTFGAAACDYPGEVARVFLVSLPSLEMKPLSPEDRLSVRAQWSPDSRNVIYSDYTQYGLIAVDVTTGKRVRLTNAAEDGPDELLGWRR